MDFEAKNGFDLKNVGYGPQNLPLKKLYNGLELEMSLSLLIHQASETQVVKQLTD